jgi:hypothetical protein
MMSRVPNQFHFVFGLKEQLEPFHLMYYLSLKSCIETQDPDKVFFYYKYEPYGPFWELIKDRLTLEQVDPVDFMQGVAQKELSSKVFSYAHLADFIRLEKIVERGGVYADIDTLFVNKYPDELFEKDFVLGREPAIRSSSTGKTEDSLCNAVIISKKGASFGVRWLKLMAQSYDGSWSYHSTILPQKLSEKYPDEIHIVPQNYFYKITYSPGDLKKLFEDCDQTVPTDMYSVHLWNHLWFSQWNKSRTNFHGGKLNYEYVSRSGSLFAQIAKPFLPGKNEVNAVNVTEPFLKRFRRLLKRWKYRVSVFSLLAMKKLEKTFQQ